MTQMTVTVEEFVDTLTGFDEIAIEKHLEFDFYEAAEAEKNIKLLRALVFVAATRDGMTAPQAKEHALGMRVGALNAVFAEPVVEVDAEQPGTESGKDDFGPESAPTS